MEGINDTLNISCGSNGDVVMKTYHDRYCNQFAPDKHSTIFSGAELREFVVWLKNNKPEILRDVMCEDCPEVC